MRIIKFRGLDFDGNWQYGYLIQVEAEGNMYSWIENCGTCTAVKNETIGQYTGIDDKNGDNIFEGDVIRCHEYDSSDTGRGIERTFNYSVVGFEHGNYYHYPNGNMNQPFQLLMYAYEAEVYDTIHTP